MSVNSKEKMFIEKSVYFFTEIVKDRNYKASKPGRGS
jgi:hypothetical protein